MRLTTSPRKRLLLTAPRPGCEVGESFATTATQPRPTMAHRFDCSSIDTVETMKDRAAVRAEIEVVEAGVRDETLEDTGSSA
ncbi:hypothetical protein Tco_0997999 [Tanacetum coccineum]